MNRVSGIRGGSMRAGGGVGAYGMTAARPSGMGDWWSDLTNVSSWNLNPVYSPTFQSVAVPVLNVAGTIIGGAYGVPVPGGSILSGVLNTTTPKAPTPAQPYSPGYTPPPGVSTQPQPAGLAATESKDNTLLYVGLAAAGAFAVYQMTRNKRA